MKLLYLFGARWQLLYKSSKRSAEWLGIQIEYIFDECLERPLRDLLFKNSVCSVLSQVLLIQEVVYLELLMMLWRSSIEMYILMLKRPHFWSLALLAPSRVTFISYPKSQQLENRSLVFFAKVHLKPSVTEMIYLHSKMLIL